MMLIHIAHFQIDFPMIIYVKKNRIALRLYGYPLELRKFLTYQLHPADLDLNY